MNDAVIASSESGFRKFVSHPVSKGLFAAVIVAIAFVVLHKLSTQVHWQDVKSDLSALPISVVTASIGFTIVSFIALSMYDVLAVHTVAKGKVPLKIAVFAGTSGYAVSNLLGFSWLTGGAIRYRIYSALNLDLTLVASIIAAAWFTFWLGIMFLMGVLLTFHPAGLSSAFGFASSIETVAGVIILAAIAALFGWLAGGQRVLIFKSYRVKLPDFKTAVSQMMVAVIDVMGAALALYVLMPADLTQNFALFFVIYTAAIGLGVASHSPGGLGVFEATIIAGLGAGGRSDVLAALLVYRIIYYVLPFAIAAVTLAGFWLLEHRQHVGHARGIATLAIKSVVAPVAAGVTLLAGITLLVSGSLPTEQTRLGVLRDIVPLGAIETSHLVGSIAGLLLVVVARGLYRRQYRAWLAAIMLMGAGLLASLIKGLDWEEALSLGVGIGLLVAFRAVFYRSSQHTLFHLSWRWALGSMILLASVFWIGLFAYSHITYTDNLWWEFAWKGDASRFLRSSVAISVVGLALCVNSALNWKPAPMAAALSIPDTVKTLVANSTDTDANIALTGDKRFLISSDAEAFLAYADSGGSLIAKGDPVGDKSAAEDLLWQFREYADQLGKRCAFYAVSTEYLPTYLDMGLTILKIGENARVNLSDFTLEGSSRKDFRQARNRAAREGFVFQIIPKAELDPHLPELKTISDKWLQSKQGSEKAFTMGAFNETYLRNFDIAVLRQGETGALVAFANLFQGAQHFELSPDLMRYDPDGPSFVMDALFAELIMWGKQHEYRWFSLGAAPFSGMHNHPLATVWNRLGSLVYRHGGHFYHFEGLRSFKEKFGPEWSPNYLACPPGVDAPRILYEVNGLVSGGVRGLLK